MTSEVFRCAEAARTRDDPLLGTAPVSRAYLLIEHPGPWRFDALAGAGWTAETIEGLSRAVRETRSRLLLIRRPGRRPSATQRRWGVVSVGAGSQWGTWQQESDLVAATDVLRAAEQIPPNHSDAVLLVCAHGVHDTCCALRGRPVAAALATSWPEQTWECSHVGGDRFAANVVVLPDGTYYGGLDADSVTGVLTRHLEGGVDADHLRGSARWPPVAQVAVGEVHRRLGPFGAGDVVPETWVVQRPGRWRVHVATVDRRRHLVEVEAEARPAAVLTCAATRPTSATSFRVASVHLDA